MPTNLPTTYPQMVPEIVPQPGPALGGRAEVLKALRMLNSPVPGLAHRRHRTIIFGGWFLFLFVAVYLAIKYSIVFLYVGAIVLARLAYILLALTAWGIASGVGAIDRKRDRHHGNTRPRP